MSELIIYLIKANIALTLFYIGYRFGLRSLTFYKLNRYYLLFAFIFSSLYPLVDWIKLFTAKAEIPSGVMTVMPDWQHLQVTNDTMGWNQLMEIFFWISATTFLIQLLIKIGGILRIHIRSVPARWTIYSYRKSKEDIVPFSFWRNIYLNPSKHKENEFDKIFKHEYVHVYQLHSIDVLIAETALTFFWYNPICWLLRKDVRENIEFITDQKVLSSGIDKQSYQYSLLNISTLSNQPILGNHFNLKNLKKRIMMMNKKQSSNTHLSKYVFILPAVVIGSLIFGLSNASEGKFDPTEVSEKQDLISFNLPQQDTSTTIKGKRVLKTDKDSTKTIRIEQKKNSMALIDTLEDGTLDISKLGDSGKGTTVVRIRRDSSQTDKEPLYVIDGKVQTSGGLKNLNPENIKSISVLKDASATSLYGEKGKNGVIEVTTKSEATSDSSKAIKGTGKITDISIQKSDNDGIKVSGYKNPNGSITIGSGKNVLYIVDGKKINEDSFDKIDPERIDSVKVFKDKKTLESYGAEEKDGVVEIITKKAKK